MTDAKIARRAPGVGRLGTAAAWIAAACCVPYLFLKVVWTLGIPVGITDRSVLDSGGWVAANALMALVQLTGLVLVLALTQPWARRLPPWLVLLPVWVGTGLLFEVVVGVVLMGLSSPPSDTAGGGTDEIRGWVFAVVYATFAGEGVALAIAFACYVRSRWSGLLRKRTGEVLATATTARSWPESHLPQVAQIVAAMAVAVGAVCWYWAAGGDVGLSEAQPHPDWYLQAARVAGAVTVVVGLLALAGRWGRGTRFGVPMGLVWIGSGALVAFDAFALLINQLFSMFGADGTASGWAPADTIVVVKAAVGLLAAWVGIVALRAAAREQQAPGVPREADRDKVPQAAG